MFDVKNAGMASRKSEVVFIEELKSVKHDRGHTIFATCSDGRTRMCHLYRYGTNDEERLAFCDELLRGMKGKFPIVFEAFGGFDPNRWFGSFEYHEESDLDRALRQAFADQAAMS